MEVEHIEELGTAIEMANNSGVWLPVASISTLLAIIIVLLIHIWRRSEKKNEAEHAQILKDQEDKHTLVLKHQEESDKRHAENETIIRQLSAIVIRLEVNDKNKGREIGEMKDKINKFLD